MKSKELLSLVKNSSLRGYSWTLVKGNRAPGPRQIERMKKQKLILDIDPKIRNLVIELNERGFKTYGSCAGHAKGAFGPHNGGGFVTIVKHKIISYKETKTLMRQLFKKHGIKKIAISDKNRYSCKDGANMFSVDFKSLGNFFINVEN